MKKTLCLLWLSYSTLALAHDVDTNQNEAGLVLDYTSAFTSYKPFKEQGLASWSVLNQQVKGGGHAGHDMSGVTHGGMSMTPDKQERPMDDSQSGHEHEMH